MLVISNYPDNWAEISTAVKQDCGYCCERCNLECLPPTASYRHLSLVLRRRLSAQTHHVDGDPSHNERANLMCLCASCHLRIHRHNPRPTPGQLSLNLKLPKARNLGRKQRKKHRNFQLTLVHLIERLPQLPIVVYHQIEIELFDKPISTEPGQTKTITQQDCWSFS